MEKVDLPEIEYNSQRGEINIAEYGRNIQKMLHYAAEIEDLDKQRDGIKGSYRQIQNFLTNFFNFYETSI